jgi:hypothetical protein
VVSLAFKAMYESHTYPSTLLEMLSYEISLIPFFEHSCLGHCCTDILRIANMDS